MLFLYNLGTQIYLLLVRISSIFNSKAKLWVDGRNNILHRIENQIDPVTKKVWFHFASLGEFEQGRPVLERIKSRYPGKQILITFFSPSGYEIRKNTPLANYVFYLPLDTAENAKKFIALINPEFAVFTKYDYWYHYFNELKKNNIPLYVISAVFWEKQSFFRWYGALGRMMLALVTQIFVQDEESKKLLKSIGINNVTVSGDTRFDRVAENIASVKELDKAAAFCSGSDVFIAGSTWPEDEKLLVQLIHDYPDWKFIIAPHEVEESRINGLTALLNDSILYSEIKNLSSFKNPQVLIINNIGMLSSLYQYAQIAYIGGGFGAGIHNTLEAAAFGLPVIFGPNYQRFREARELIAEGAAFRISNSDELKSTMLTLQTNSAIAGERASSYVKNNTGATDLILNEILK